MLDPLLGLAILVLRPGLEIHEKPRIQPFFLSLLGVNAKINLFKGLEYRKQITLLLGVA